MNIEGYTPDLPSEGWAHVRRFVLDIVDATSSDLSYPLPSLINAVAHHVDWCVNVGGLKMAREELFRREVIGAAVAMMPTRSPSTRGRRRSLLLRVGEALGVIPVPVELTPLAAATPTTPYTTNEVAQLETWARLQRNAETARSARVLIALGVGAGLPTRELGGVRAVDILDDGTRVRVVGAAARIVPVADDWADELNELSTLAPEGSTLLFHPGVARSKNFVTIFVSRCIGAGIRPTTQRMRSTWLVNRLAEGTPMQDLLYAAGLKSMDALTRYQRFLPSPSEAGHEGTRR